MPFVVEDVVRYSINGTFDGRQIVNLWDVALTGSMSSSERAAACQSGAAALLHLWDDNILVEQVNDYTANSVSWVDLDSADGSTGEITAGGGDTWPKQGTVTGSPMPSSVAALATKVINGGRSRRNGRLYLCGIAEPATPDATPNSLDSVTVARYTTKLNAVLSGVNSTIPFAGVTAACCVVHITSREPGSPGRPGVPLTGDYRPITTTSFQSRLATQRRRLRG